MSSKVSQLLASVNVYSKQQNKETKVWCISMLYKGLVSEPSYGSHVMTEAVNILKINVAFTWSLAF